MLALAEGGGKASHVAMDARVPDSVEAAVAHVKAAHNGTLDYAFNNAGIDGAWRPLHEIKVCGERARRQDITRILCCNLKSFPCGEATHLAFFVARDL